MELATDVTYSLVESTTHLSHSLVDAPADGSYSFVDKSGWIPCEKGFDWSEEMGECQPVLVPRSYRSCPWGYKMNGRYKQCMRVKYHGKHQWDVFRKWWHKILNPPVSRKPIRKREPTKATTAYTGAWFGYNLGYGKDVKRP
ncbi:uncharacterized protein DMAD_03777 [Drosophila madeirensis]|uniref:Uncharacterized protein n=1 Tax=Drosophila madeirensis TaxID=30013 RepID=A0AAU9G9Z6_DROMD